MQPGMENGTGHTRVHARPQQPAAAPPAAEVSSAEDYLHMRARNRAADAAYDLFEALRNADLAGARWVLNEVSWRVLTLPG